MSHPVPESRSRSRLRLSTALSLFRREEDGSFIIFSLFIFMVMIMIGGIAIDVMRFENLRTTMQNTVDRAVLAAADLDQTMDPEEVVADYLDKAGMGDLPYTVNVVENTVGDTVVGRRVAISSEVAMKTYFMSMMGTPTISVPATTAATEAINEIEVSLVLDVSGSMGWNNKLRNMQDAATDFVDEIMTNSLDGGVSMSVVPYSTQVNAGATLAGQFNLTGEHGYSHCVDFSATDFATVGLSNTIPLQRTAHFDPWTSYTRDDPQNFVCRTEADFEITPWSTSSTALKNQIDGLTASGNTSIDIAAKWGTALLDPSTAPVLSNLVATGAVDADLDGRPAAHNNNDVLKFMVLMTDGINTTQYGIKPSHASGPSGIWRDPDSGRYSMEDEESNDTDRDGRWREDYWIAGGWNKSFGRFWNNDIWDRRPNGSVATGSQRNAYELDWSEVWARMPLHTVAYNFFYLRYWNANHYWNFRDAAWNWVNAAEKDARLNQICTQAKNEGIVIFAIGFEVTDYSAGVMQNCASTANHFYRVEGLDISYAFKSIANQINQLKLTQ